MNVAIPYGLQHLELKLADERIVSVHRESSAPRLSDPVDAVRQALESPRDFPALRRALTPDDHVAIVIDEGLPRLGELLVPILEHVQSAGVSPSAVTLICPAGDSEHKWRCALPEAFRSVTVETHDPANRKKLAYLAATRKGRRVYLNRTAVDADQVVVLSRRGYDPLLGYSGNEGSLYPALSDAATRDAYASNLTHAVPDEHVWPIRREAGEITWLMGAPFMLQVIEGEGDEITHVLGGVAESGNEGIRLLDGRWRIAVDDLADTVIAGVSGNPERHDFVVLARAAACAARVVKPQGRILLLTDAKPTLDAATDFLRQTDDADRALALLRKQSLPDPASVFLWATAARRASTYLLSRLPAEIVEELFATPLEHASQVQRLLDGKGKCLVIPDAHKTLAVVEAGAEP